MSGSPTHPPNPNPTKKRKSLYLIRHAESEENRRLASLQSVIWSVLGLSWPKSADVRAALELVDVSGQVDSPVSSRGKLQILDMRTQLERERFLEANGVELILHSPLQRAWETSMGLFPPESILAGKPLTTTGSACRMEETDLLLEKTPTEWIFTSTFHERIRQFAEFVEDRPETTIVAVGHSQFFRAMLGLRFKFNNCDVWHVELALPSSSSPQSSALGSMSDPAGTASSLDAGNGELEEVIATQPPWSDLRRVFVCSSISESSGTETDGGSGSDGPHVGADNDGGNPSSAKDKNA
jgi:broad specificity phosphatase PhoE